jgi:energy-coupling factor transporter ATP-binding protein EcfA2
MSDWRIGISEVRIRNFRGIEDLALSFRQPNGEPTRVCVIVGPNGCGKTTVLEACLVAGSFRGPIRGAVGPRAVRVGAEDYLIEMEYVDRDSVAPKKGRASLIEHFVGYTLPFTYFSSWRTPHLIGAVGITSGEKNGNRRKSEDNRLREIKQTLVNRRAHQFFEQSRGQHQLFPDFQIDPTLDRINSVWKSFFANQWLTVEPVSDDPDQGFDVFVNNGDQHFPLEVLSSGQLEIFMFAGGLAIEKFDHGVIVIDEPELHLDPQWHRTVLKSLLKLKPNCQFIVGTHSPEIYESVMSFERHFLVPEDDPRADAWLNRAGAGNSQ